MVVDVVVFDPSVYIKFQLLFLNDVDTSLKIDKKAWFGVVFFDSPIRLSTKDFLFSFHGGSKGKYVFCGLTSISMSLARLRAMHIVDGYFSGRCVGM